MLEAELCPCPHLMIPGLALFLLRPLKRAENGISLKPSICFPHPCVHSARLQSTVPVSVREGSKEAPVRASCPQRSALQGGKVQTSRTRESWLPQGAQTCGEAPRVLVEQGRLPGGGGALRQDWGSEEGWTQGPTCLDKDMKTDL